jgi:diacylglycerol O-acyltransferase / wax synthase
MSRKATMIVTNVPGPRERQHLLGVPLEHLLVWVPQAGGLGVGVSLVSYAGQVRIGVAADHLRLEDPGRLARRVADEIGVLESSLQWEM